MIRQTGRLGEALSGTKPSALGAPEAQAGFQVRFDREGVAVG